MMSLYVDVPMASFRPQWARNLQETYLAPPPSTIMGMLLSMMGVEREFRGKYDGRLEMAVAIAEECYRGGDSLQKARVFRKMRRVLQDRGNSSDQEFYYANRAPEYQEILLDLKLWLWLRPVANAGEGEDLLHRIAAAAKRGSGVQRHGALSLGESTNLVNQIKQKTPHGQGRFLELDQKGFLSMPVWVDHAADPPSRFEKFTLSTPEPLGETVQQANRWIRIGTDAPQ